MKCPVCLAEAPELRLAARDADRGQVRFDIALCSACRSGGVLAPPTGEELGRWYQAEYYGHGESKFASPLQALVDWSVRRQAARIMRRLGRASRPRILDIGCGRGTLLSALAAQGAEAIGLERAGRELEVPGVEIREGELVDQRFPAGHFDAVILWHVFEHLDDPLGVIDELARVMADGALLVLAVPNNASWQATWFGARWFHLDLPRHLHFFGHEGLCRLMVERGFTLEKTSTSDLLQGVFGFVQSALNLLPGVPPNRMYALMRSGVGRWQRIELLLWSLPAALLVLPAMIEFALSAWRRRGACSILYLRR
jgi:SAM-dependent methyltransferase